MTDPGLTELHHRTSTTRLVLITIVVLIIVAVIVIAGIVPRERAKAALRIETNDLAVPTVAVIQAKRGSPQQEIVLPGNMQPFIESPIYARTNGYLKKWTHDIGAHVKTGELLAEIETPEVDAQLEQARSDLNTAIANMKLAQVTAERYVSSFDWDTFYSRQVALAELGREGQQKLKRSKVAVIGLGGLGSVSSIYLALAGVGHLRLVDQDTVELNNIHRQLLYTLADLKYPKAETAAKKIHQINPEIKVESISENAGPRNIEQIVKDVDCVVDGLDNM